MSLAKAPRALLISAVAVAAIICASTANAAAPVIQGGDPTDPVGPFPAESMPTPAETVGHALADWIAEHPDASAAGGVRVLKDRKTVLVYWKGAVPAGLQSLAARQPVSVTFKPAPHSRAELTAAVRSLMVNNPDTVAAAGSLPDYSAISVLLSTKAPPNALAAVKAKATGSIPIVSRGVGDPAPLDGQAPTVNDCPTPARCGDSAPFYGGSAMRIPGRSGSGCSTGVSLYAGAYNYMTTAWHCSADGSGTWVGYDSGNVIGSVNVAAGHIKAAHDFMIIGTSSNFGRIWFGDWKTTASIRVGGMEHPQAATTGPVACSCGISGNGHYQYILLDNEMWRVRGRLVGPGFYTEAYPDRNDPNYPSTGWVKPGDSGSPVVRGSSYYLVQGFVSAGLFTSPYCAPGGRPGSSGPCYTEYWATYADVAIGSIGGLHLKTS